MKIKVQDTNTEDYANYLMKRQNSLVTKLFQLPYQNHLRLLRLKRVLEIGCGAGRNLRTCSKESVGIDHNLLLVNACKKMGLTTFSTEEWESRVGNENSGSFDTLLISHVAEHIQYSDFVTLLKKYSQYLKSNGRVVVLCPQERGYASDATHIEFMNFERLESSFIDASLNEGFKYKVNQRYSFPFPRFMGKYFLFNEFVVIASKEPKL